MSNWVNTAAEVFYFTVGYIAKKTADEVIY